MTTRSTGRSIVVAAAALLALLVAAPIAQAKEGTEVALAAPISPDAKPGDVVTVFFTARSVTETGESPLRGAAIFFRLYGPTDAMTQATGVEQSQPGSYKAMIEIPAGGAARAEFGIHGSASTGAADVVWPYDGVLVAASVPGAVDPKTYQLPGQPRYEPVTPATGSGPALAADGGAAPAASAAPFPVDPRAIGVGALVVTALAALAAVGLRHRRPRHATPA